MGSQFNPRASAQSPNESESQSCSLLLKIHLSPKIWDLFCAVLMSVLSTDLLFTLVSPVGVDVFSFYLVLQAAKSAVIWTISFFPYRWPVSKAHHSFLLKCLPLHGVVDWCWSPTGLSFALNPNTWGCASLVCTSFKVIYLSNYKIRQLRPGKRTVIHFPPHSFSVSPLPSILSTPVTILKWVAGMASTASPASECFPNNRLSYWKLPESLWNMTSYLGYLFQSSVLVQETRYHSTSVFHILLH